MNSRILFCGALALVAVQQTNNVQAIHLDQNQAKQSSNGGIFSKMIEEESAGQTAAQEKDAAKKRHQEDMALAEKEHEQAVKEEEEEEAKAKKEADDKAENDLHEAEVQQRLQAQKKQQNDQVAAQLEQQMSTEELQAQAQQQLLEEEARIRSVKPKGMLERAQQNAQLEQSEKATAEALQALAGAKVSLAQTSSVFVQSDDYGNEQVGSFVQTQNATADSSVSANATAPANATGSANTSANASSIIESEDAATISSTFSSNTTNASIPTNTTTAVSNGTLITVNTTSNTTVAANSSAANSSNSASIAGATIPDLAPAAPSIAPPSNKKDAPVPAESGITETVPSAPCAFNKDQKIVKQDNGHDMLPYPVTFEDKKKSEDSDKPKVRPAKYHSNFEKPSFGAPEQLNQICKTCIETEQDVEA